MRRLPTLMLLLALLLNACSSDRHRSDQATNPSPMEVSADPAAHAGRPVTWGGEILASRNLRHHSELEILAYPLDSQDYPLRQRPPRGRFIAIQTDYLETAELSPGKLVSIHGRVAGLREKKLGEALRIYPEILIESKQLWSTQRQWYRPRFNIGIGGGNRGVGVGIGIGL